MTLIIAGTASALLLVVAALVAWLAPETNARFADAAAALAFVTAAAVGIERTIETGWTVVGNLVGTFWPLNAVAKQVDQMVADLDEALKPFHEELTEDLARLAEVNADMQAGLAAAQAQVRQLKGRFDGLKELPHDNQRLQLLATAAARNIKLLSEKYGEQLPDLNLKEAGLVAGEAIDGLQNFAASFKDNPGRRLISLYVGAMLGLALAGAFGLDLFAAVMDPARDGADSVLTAHRRLNIVLTGVIIGLGSSPTHEVIRAVQEYKKNRKGANIAQPDVP
jgi:hypothetical protein